MFMDKTIQIQNISAEKGVKKNGFIKIGESPRGSLELPLTIINGKGEGPILCLTAGIHACEYAGIAAVMRLLKETNADELSGAILGMPIQNMSCFEDRRPYLIGPTPFGCEYLSSRDVEPDPSGTIGSRLVDVLYNQVIQKSDMHIDCHGGDYDERLNPNTYYTEIGEQKHDEISNVLSRIYGFRYVIKQPTLSAAFSVPHHPGEKIVPSIVAECGGLKTLIESDVNQHLEGMRNVMKFYKMIGGRPRIKVNQFEVEDFFIVRPEKGGLFYPKTDVGDKVSRGIVLGEIWNVWGEIIETLTSPCEGIIRKLFTNHAVYSGDPLIQIMKSPKPITPFHLTDPYIELDEYDQTSKIYV
jgi:predicted deacylase